ncbi:hypothetical protein E2C01_047209 [Portunus trituberculatus]|uniref:Uncharacterized protein n=1 Tax=Portunus trituberculatus TaxID=210409 RepID=A0A5B7FZU2_PORTR|nr:hypothetical protein [Portunus trituberculatus]
MIHETLEPFPPRALPSTSTTIQRTPYSLRRTRFCDDPPLAACPPTVAGQDSIAPTFSTHLSLGNFLWRTDHRQELGQENNTYET